MKKLIYAFSALAFLFVSCSSDSDTAPVNTAPVLLTKIIATDGSGTQTTDYHYEGNKVLDGTHSNGSKNVYYYTGNLITKTAWFESGSTSPANEEFLEYDSQGRIVETVIYYYSGSTSALRNAYQHNTDGTISYERFTGDFSSQNNLVKRGKFFLNAAGEVIKVEHYDLSDNLIEKEIYLHDAKNSPFKNIVGFNKLFVYPSVGKWNNIVSYGSYNSANTLSHGYEVDCEYTSGNFPSNMIWNYSDGNILNYQLFYE